jgi:signal transduction histidine kinase
MNLLKNRSITDIHLVAMLIMLLFVLLFTTLLIYEKYSDFEKDSNSLRKTYIQKQKETVYFDINRVMNYIQYEYDNQDKLMDEEELKLKVVDTIEHLYGREDGTGYIFIYSFSGIKISDPIWSEDIGENFYTIKDMNGIELLKELITVAKNHDDSFVQYTWKKPTTEELALKLSHAKAFEPWDWIVGTGIYLDEVEKFIDADRVALKKRLIKYVMEILALTVILFGIGLIGIIVINNIIAREIDIFSNYFKKASKSYVTIDENEIYLIRFKTMVYYVNSMVREIHLQKEELQAMNTQLERKVEQKTKDINYLLEKQDSFIKHSIHEINTPLAVIMTHLDILKMKFGENRYLSKIEAGTKMIANIYDDLSYMVKQDRFVYKKETINFSQFLKSRIDFFEEIASGNRHEIIVNIEKNIKVYFNETELQRVIDNNLSNAIKYAKKDTIIKIYLKEKSTKTLLEFETNSSKIEDTHRIFEAFHQVKALQNGFGLGLDIVASICSKNHVAVDVKSDDDITIFSYLF